MVRMGNLAAVSEVHLVKSKGDVQWSCTKAMIHDVALVLNLCQARMFRSICSWVGEIGCIAGRIRIQDLAIKRGLFVKQ